MEVIRHIDKDVPSFKNLVLTSGIFDGVHLGHRAIIGEVVKRSRRLNGTAGAMTFDPHPREVLAPESAPSLLTCTEKKLELMSELGIDVTFVVEFTKDFASVPAERFVRETLVERLRVKELVIGHDYRFGANREGDRLMLQRLGKDLGFTVDQVDPVYVEGTVVSSTLIRQMVLEGKLEDASACLGRLYSITGRVVEGVGRGKKIGYPTANIVPYRETVPPTGIYAVKVNRAEETYPGTLNIGVRPTFGDDLGVIVEVYVLDFEGDLYEEDLEIVFVEKLREELKFKDVSQLVDQMGKDVQRTRELLVV